MDYNEFLIFVDKYKIIIVLLVALLIFLTFIIIRVAKKKSLQKSFDELEIKYNELMGIPILFKINKASGLAKINEEIERDVDSSKELFEEIRLKQDSIVNLMGDADDALAFSKFKDAKVLVGELDSKLDDALDLTYKLDSKLELLLEEETQQRMRINQLKNTFRKQKASIISLENQLGDSHDALEAQTHEIENLFSTFEEWMYASDFVKASETSTETEAAIELLEERLVKLPKLYEKAKGYIPELLDEVSRLYQGVRQEGVFVEHLEVPKNIGLLSEILKEDLIQLSQGEIEKTSTSLNESQKRLEQLVVEIQKENKANSDLKENFDLSTETLASLGQGLSGVQEEASRIEERFDFDGFAEQLEEMDTDLKQYNDKHLKIQRMKDEENIPASTILISVQELKQDINILMQDFINLQKKIQQANADEVRAKNQLLKLHLIINDVQVRIKNRSLPSISNKYKADLAKSYGYTDQIKSMLSQKSLDVKLLNATVDEAIDYIYKLHNNVNNLVGVVDMCENAIVYANRYRAYIPDIEAQLTRAELSFNNGEYTQSLTTVINSIDRYRPNTKYEEMIRENAKSAE